MKKSTEKNPADKMQQDFSSGSSKNLHANIMRININSLTIIRRHTMQSYQRLQEHLTNLNYKNCSIIIVPITTYQKSLAI